MTDETPFNAAITVAPDPHWVPRARRILTIGAWVTGVLSVVLTVALMVLGSSVIGPAFDADGGVMGALGWILMVAPSILFVVALNLLVWRALLRTLARRDRTTRTALIIGVTAALAVGSFFVVASLMFIGFLFTASSGG